MNQYDLKGRRAVVTGAAQGFGLAITERFLDSGASVALWDLDADETAKAARELGARGPVFTQAVDVSDLAQVEAAAAVERGACAVGASWSTWVEARDLGRIRRRPTRRVMGLLITFIFYPAGPAELPSRAGSPSASVCTSSCWK